MTISQFLANGGEIDPIFDLVSHCQDSFDSDYADQDFKTCDDLVQYSCDQDKYSEDQRFDEDSEFFYIFDSHAHLIGKHFTNEEATKLIHNLTEA